LSSKIVKLSILSIVQIVQIVPTVPIVHILVWHRDPPSKSVILTKWLAFSIPKTTSSFGYKKQVVNMAARFLRQKQSYWRWLNVGIQKADTYSQGYYCQTKTEDFGLPHPCWILVWQ
jgi:hypothetical protein